MKSVVMTSGEMDYEQVFRFRDFDGDCNKVLANGTTLPPPAPPGKLNYTTMTYILWVVFVIMMPVLFANLLVSTAITTLAIYVHHKALKLIFTSTDWSCCW